LVHFGILDALHGGLEVGPHPEVAAHDDRYLRRAALDYAVPTVTTLAGARAAVEAIAALHHQGPMEVVALQDIHPPWVG
ncbi:MAG TPA: hypothetical protein VER57_03155, partial [Cyanobium sp.]|nr:hypothetical protein [Cyanobium sp.]